MQNIDAVFILQPVVVILVCLGLIGYWRFRRSFRGIILVYSLVAYALAIALKYAVQIPTASSVVSYFGAHSVEVGVYYGLQTVFFEVGVAFLVAWYTVSHGKLTNKDAEAFGLGLGFWENAVLLGLLSLINLVTYYAVLSTNTAIAQTLYTQLMKSSPDLFSGPPKVFGLVAAGIAERISSIMLHFAWGYLCVVAAYFHKRKYLMIALPMGFVDFLVPFVQSSNLYVFEAVVFVISVLSVIIAWLATKELRKPSASGSVRPQMTPA